MMLLLTVFLLFFHDLSFLQPSTIVATYCFYGLLFSWFIISMIYRFHNLSSRYADVLSSVLFIISKSIQKVYRPPLSILHSRGENRLSIHDAIPQITSTMTGIARYKTSGVHLLAGRMIADALLINRTTAKCVA